MTGKRERVKKKMPPLQEWNPILLRLYEKSRDINLTMDFKDVAKIIGVTQHDMSNWTHGKKMSEDKIVALTQYMERANIPPQDIVYVIKGENLTVSGAFRLLHSIDDR
jgi:phage antirepressor YoqD-like protein